MPNGPWRLIPGYILEMEPLLWKEKAPLSPKQICQKGLFGILKQNETRNSNIESETILKSEIQMTKTIPRPPLFHGLFRLCFRLPFLTQINIELWEESIDS
jgi:hypothetical protein